MAGKSEAIKYFLRRTFDLRQGEVQRALLLQLNLFLIIATLLIVKPTVNGLFLARFGVNSLPGAYVLVAFSAWILSFFYSGILARYHLRTVIRFTLLASISTLLFLGLALNTGILSTWILYLFYVWVALFALVATSQLWILGNVVFNAREARRLFGFVAAGGTAGGIFGGYFTSLLAPVLGSENLVFFAAAMLAGCIPISGFLWKHKVLPHQGHFEVKKREKSSDISPLRLILKSRHLTYLAIILGLSVMVAKLVDYQYGAMAAEKFPDKDELSAFFGFWLSTLSFLSLLIQLFVTNRVVGFFGVAVSLFVLPVSIMGGALLMLIQPSLAASLVMKVSDGSLKQSLNKAASELLILPIPLEVKKSTKSFIDIFIDSLATGVVGILLYLLVNAAQLPGELISLLIIVFLLAWIYFIRQVGKEYVLTFKAGLETGELNSSVPSFDLSRESVLSGLKKVLESGGDNQKLFVLRKIREDMHGRLYPAIRHLIRDPNPEIRVGALRSLYYYSREDLVAEVSQCLKDKDGHVRIAAFEYLIRHAPTDKAKVIAEFLKDQDQQVHGAALISLAKEARDNPELRRRFGVEKKILSRLDEWAEIKDPVFRKALRIDLLKAIGFANIPLFNSILHRSFSDPDSDIVRQAILSAGETMSAEFPDKLLPFLIQPPYFHASIQALQRLGPELCNFLKGHLEHLDVEILRKLPRLLEKIPAQSSVRLLFDLAAHNDLLVRSHALRGLNHLHRDHPELKFDRGWVHRALQKEAAQYRSGFTLLFRQKEMLDKSAAEGERIEIQEARKNLVQLLEHRQKGTISRILRLLRLKYPPEDIILVYKGLKSPDASRRMNAVELLANVLTPRTAKSIIPIVELAASEQLTIETIRSLGEVIPDASSCLKIILEGNDLRLKISALYLTSLSDPNQFQDLRKKIATDVEPELLDFLKRMGNAGE